MAAEGYTRRESRVCLASAVPGQFEICNPQLGPWQVDCESDTGWQWFFEAPWDLRPQWQWEQKCLPENWRRRWSWEHGCVARKQQSNAYQKISL